MKNKVVIIPSRYGSSRFDGKPLHPIQGKPMIQWVYERCCRAGGITAVAVATDDQRIYHAVSAFGGRAVMTGTACRSGSDRVAEAADRMGLASEDIIVNVQGDQPLINPCCIDDVLRPFGDDPSVAMTTLAFKIVESREITDPKDCKVVFDHRGDALYFSRSPIPLQRDADTAFDTYKHLGVYAYTRSFLEIYRTLPEGRLEGIEKLEQLRVLEYGYRIRVVVTDHDSPEVDLPEDISRIESHLKQ